VIADAYVERDFGTGALKITPAHDANDFEVGARHQLGRPVVIDAEGRIRAVATPPVASPPRSTDSIASRRARRSRSSSRRQARS